MTTDQGTIFAFCRWLQLYRHLSSIDQAEILNYSAVVASSTHTEEERMLMADMVQGLLENAERYRSKKPDKPFLPEV